MADDDLNLDESDAGTAAPEKKKGGLGGIFPVLIKWVLIAIGAIIVIVSVVVVTVKIMGTNNSSQATVAIADEYTEKRESYDWYQSIGQIRTKTSDANMSASVVVEVVLGYKKEDKVTSTEITSRQIEIKDFLRRYFTGKTVQELRPQNEDKLKEEIRNSINDDILNAARIKDVKFLSFEVIEQ